MTDPKARKVILLENPMLPVHVKEIIANTCLALLSVPSLSFACAPLCSLLSLGRITGLVLDVGNLESCLLPVRFVSFATHNAAHRTSLVRYTPRDRCLPISEQRPLPPSI